MITDYSSDKAQSLMPTGKNLSFFPAAAQCVAFEAFDFPSFPANMKPILAFLGSSARPYSCDCFFRANTKIRKWGLKTDILRKVVPSNDPSVFILGQMVLGGISSLFLGCGAA